jgi:hypothetical protein
MTSGSDDGAGAARRAAGGGQRKPEKTKEEKEASPAFGGLQKPGSRCRRWRLRIVRAFFFHSLTVKAWGWVMADGPVCGAGLLRSVMQGALLTTAHARRVALRGVAGVSRRKTKEEKEASLAFGGLQ